MILSRSSAYLFGAALFLAACAEGQRVAVPVELGQARTSQPIQPPAAPASSAKTETAETNKIVIADAPVDEKTADTETETETDTDAPAATDIAELQPDEIVAAPEEDSRFEIITEDDGPEETLSEDRLAEDITAQDIGAEADTEAPATLDDTASTEMASLIQAPDPEPAPPPPPAPPAQLQPASLVGLTNQSLESEIGAADFIRTEGKMQVWQYKLGSCITDFFLYPADGQETASVFLVTDWYSRASTFGTHLNARKCREDLATRQRF